MKKTAIVTGGSRGIGLAIAKRLATDGYNLSVLATQSAEAHREQIDAIRALGAEVLYVQGNMGSAQDRARLVEETVQRFGGIHVLVNNAGVGPKVRNDLLDMTEESWDHVLGINAKGTMFLTQAVAKQMIRQEPVGKKRGTIVNISSCSAVVSSVSRGEYCVSKAGVSMLTTLFADRLAPEGILVNEVRPGVISTDMTSGVKEKYDALIEAGVFPIARWGTPEDVADAVAALVSDSFLYTTGNYIDVDGGFHIKRL
ncbi:MAG TPA: 3-ketoacyl-ACP reductase [Candidatus Limiplasma sp.]|nr:3-ketoacyl-ACP reductase [Candidatus Limiplasma sp.]